MRNALALCCILCAVVLVAGLPRQAAAQQDKEVRAKQGELKKEYNDLQERNQLIRAAAKDKPAPTTGRRRGSITTGYDYTQVKGYALRPADLQDRLDKLFRRASELGYFDEEYYANGATTVPCPNGQGSSSISRVEVYVVEATPEEMEEQQINPYDLMEIRVIKQQVCPEKKESEEEEESDELGRRRMSTGMSTTLRSYSLSGIDLWTAIKVVDESLYDDVLARRTQETPIALPADLFLPDKRGPFIVMTQRDLETSTSRFRDFWNAKDTTSVNLRPATTEASGPFFRGEVPVMTDESRKVRIKNPNKEPITISSIAITGGEDAGWKATTKTPLVLNPMATQDVAFDYSGQTDVETHSQLLIESKDAKLSQSIELIANPGRFPSDFATLDLSLERLEARSPARSGFAPDWKIFYQMGNPEIGLPRWSSGMSTLGVGYKHQMSVGIVMPMNMTAPNLPSPLAFNNTLLYSPMGYNVSFDFNFGFPFSLGGSLTVANHFDAEDAYHSMRVTDPGTMIDDKPADNMFFNISTVALLYYPIMFKDKASDPGLEFRLNLGGAMMRVERNLFATTDQYRFPDGTLRNVQKGKLYWLEKQEDIVDIYLRLDFINVAAKNNYGIGMQYFAGRMMADAWLELTDWLRVEAKYSFLLRTREVWESENNYFMITPRLRIGLPSTISSIFK